MHHNFATSIEVIVFSMAAVSYVDIICLLKVDSS